MNDWIKPDWPVPLNVHSFFTTKKGGHSQGPYQGLNLATHVNDNPRHVTQNRSLLRGFLPAEPVWMDQTHSNVCADADTADNIDLATYTLAADASFTAQPQRVLAVLVADCLPILLYSSDPVRVAVVHAGWRGLAAGVIGALISAAKGAKWSAWLGPCIGPCHYIVGDEVKAQFADNLGFVRDPGSQLWSMDLTQIALMQLEKLNVIQVYGGGLCTSCDARRFYSYRRDGVTGRNAGIIWLGTPD